MNAPACPACVAAEIDAAAPVDDWDLVFELAAELARLVDLVATTMPACDLTDSAAVLARYMQWVNETPADRS